jgi:CheY-like chemotaxis protein
VAGKKLLVADDSLTIQKVIRLALSNEGYEIQAVSDGNDAIQQISLFRPDVVLVDVSLPGKSAFEVKKAINGQGDFEETRFVLMSSAFEKVDEALADEARFHGRLTKPFDPAHLRQVLTEVLEQVAAKRMEPTAILQPTPPPLAPTEPPVLAGKPEEIHDLWDKDEPGTDLIEKNRTHEIASDGDPFASLSPPPLTGLRPPAPPAPPPAEPGTDSDIRQLTESTIKMSGLDDFQWSVSETGKKALPPAPPPPAPRAPSTVEGDALERLQAREPSLKPFSGMSDLGGTSFSLDDPSEGEPPGMPPFHPETLGGARPAFSLDNDALSEAEEGPPAAYRDAPETPDTVAESALELPPSAPGGPPPFSGPQVMPITTKQMEELLQRQLHDTLEKMAQKILPDVAERVIKQEINRLLREQP